MRVDLFLSTTNILKRRTLAADMCDEGIVFINDKKAKRSSEVKAGDKIKIKLLNEENLYLVLELPAKKSIPKSESSLYVEKLNP